MNNQTASGETTLVSSELHVIHYIDSFNRWQVTTSTLATRPEGINALIVELAIECGVLPWHRDRVFVQSLTEILSALSKYIDSKRNFMILD